MSVVDSEQRRRALDPLRSFCVSAPAGSGKTELLIQRYLGLLARVQEPEQVLAITFTRKAAAEMRQRVVEALLAARDDRPCESEHEQTTRELAQRALAADQAGGWQLTRDINRVNVKTIDSFCGGLVRQMPVLSEFGGQAAILDNAEQLYREAVSRLLADLGRDTPAGEDLRALLLHFDNNWQRLEELFIEMLQRREQWREYVGLRHTPGEAEDFLLRTVRTLVDGELAWLAGVLQPFSPRLLALYNYAATNLERPPLTAFPDATATVLPQWRSLRDFLLTRTGSWRRKVTINEGFPAGGEECKRIKQEFLDLVEQLRDLSDVEANLAALDRLPQTAAGEPAWQLVLHLFHVLPRLAAELLLVFSRHGQVDHSQVAMSALQALGDDDAPTELALRLDYRLEHILVDEFQDTANSQYELVRRLTRGWGSHNAANPESPRTIMIVGDGMQSIYGFRDANVGLFLKAREEGFNDVRLEPVQPRCNFRSAAGIVDWVNATFARGFPETDDMHRGQVRFTDAVSVRQAANTPAVECHGFEGEGAVQEEVDYVCAVLQRGVEVVTAGRLHCSGAPAGSCSPLPARFASAVSIFPPRTSKHSVIPSWCGT